jgi:pimeloyl-ACP methyl ester carboxylesterase
MRGLTCLVIAVALLGATAARAQTVAGDWLGGLVQSPASTLRLAVHLRKAADGGYGGSVDSLDQAVYGLPISDVKVAADTLSFAVAIKAAPASYQARWDAATGRWVGKWTQGGQPMDLVLSPGVAQPSPTIAGLDGAWDGVLKTPSAQLHLVLHVKTGPGGTVAGLDSVDQLAYGLNVSSLSRAGDAVGFELPALRVVFKGTLAADGQSMSGQFVQGDTPMPLTLTRRAAAVATAPNRPQTPQPPFPYTAQDVAFDDAAAHVRLAGTLTLPPGPGPFPAVVLVAGSGPNTRDEPILGHKPFLVLADYLTRHGVAVLRYDKRGVGGSSGDYAAATSQDFADDAAAAAAWLRRQPSIDAAHVGLIGHSEGGIIAPMVAARDPKIAFVVLLAGSGVNGADLLLEQGRLIAKAAGAPDAAVAANAEVQRQIFAIVRAEKDPAVAAVKLKAVVDAFAAAHGLPPAGLETQAIAGNSPWFRYFYDYDPAPTLAKLRCPVLALNGSKDLQVPPAQNLPPIRAALAHNPDAEVDELPGLNHLFQTADTGALGEYARIEETMAPSVLEKVTAWILRRVGTKPA